MRIFWLIFAMSVAAAAPARASQVVVMLEPVRASELGAALEVELAGRRVAVASLPPPAGPLRLDRAAAAQHAAVQLGADAAVWIDREDAATDVCVVSADGRQFRRAPLPPDVDSPRAFAAIAASLLDELIATPDLPLAVNVDVQVSVTPAVAAPTPAVLAPPAVIAPPMAHATIEVARPAHAGSVLLEGGASIGILGISLEGGALLPISDRWRAGPIVSIGAPFLVDGPIVSGVLEVRRVGLGSRHYDLGGFGGAMVVDNDGVGVVGVRASHVWEGRFASTQLSISPALLIGDRAHQFGAAVWVSLRWGIAL
jgi:hypothetical protein